MANRKSAAVELREQRLHIAQDSFSGRRVAHVAHCRQAGQTLDHLTAGEVVSDEPQSPLGMKSLAVERNDAGGFLPAMLEGVQAERGDRSRICVPEYAEDAALFTQPVAVKVESRIASSLGHLPRLLVESREGHRDLPRVNSRKPARSDAPYPPASLGTSMPERWPAAGSSSSSFGFFNLFKMVLSGSSGNMDINQSPVPWRTIRDFALRTHSGWLRSGTSQAKKRKAMTTMIRPRARPNRKPSVRSSAPMRLSRTMSEKRTVITDTINSVTKKVPPITTPAATMSLLK